MLQEIRANHLPEVSVLGSDTIRNIVQSVRANPGFRNRVVIFVESLD
jgi:hypothetical protein